jgi:PAS domain S-box-containing protein
MQPLEQVNILMVDDRPENLLTLEALLEPLGQNLIKAFSGREALRRLLDEDFAVILLDVEMPGMDGFETAELIRGRERSQFTPIIFLTAINTSNTHVFKGYSLGAVDYLLKPIVPEILRSKISVFIELFRKTEEVKRQAETLNKQAEELRVTVSALQVQVSERRRAEDGLRKAHDELELRVQERTASLAEANAALRVEINERKKVEEALRESEGRFRRLYESNIVGVLFAGLDGRIYEGNDAFLSMLGYNRQALEAGQLRWDELTPPVYRAQDEHMVELLRATRHTPAFEKEYICKDGSHVAVVIAAAMLEGSDERVVAFVLDITDRKRAEQGLWFLAESSRLLTASLDYQTSLNSVARMIVPLQADWCAIDLRAEEDEIRRVAFAANSPELERIEREILYRYPLESNLPFCGREILTTGKPIFHQELADALLEAEAIDAEHLALLRARQLRSLVCVPLEARGVIIGAMSLGMTDSGRHFDEQAIKLLEDFSCRVAAAVDNAQLYAEVQEAVRARDTFLSIAAHELKTPLTALLGYTELIRRRIERDGGKKERDVPAIQVLCAQAGRLNRMVNSLLDLSRIETGQLSIERGQVNLCELGRRLIEEIQPTIDEHTMELVCSEDPLLIEGDELRLEQVLQNLLQNAIKYSPGGGVVQLRIDRVDEQACIAVADQGMGIPSDALPQLFSRFYRAANANALRISGMGVGLYVVREIVMLHGGSVEVESREGQGSTFMVRLPLTAQTVEAEAEA